MPSSVWTVTASVVDQAGKFGRTSVYLPNATTAANVITFADAWVDAMRGILNGQIVSYSITREVTVPALFGPGADFNQSDVEEGLQLSFETDTGYTYAPRIPATQDTIYVPGTDKLDVSNAAVGNFLDVYFAGVAGVGGQLFPTDNRGIVLSSQRGVQGAQSFRRYRP